MNAQNGMTGHETEQQREVRTLLEAVRTWQAHMAPYSNPTITVVSLFRRVETLLDSIWWTVLAQDEAAVERAARALWEETSTHLQLDGRIPWDEAGQNVRGLYLHRARVALAAAQEGP